MKPFVCKLMGVQWIAITPGVLTEHDSQPEAFTAALERMLVSEATA